MTSKTAPSAGTPSTGPSAGTHAHDGTAYVFDEELGNTSASARAGLVEVLRRELIGPAEGDTEILTTPPDDRYLLGRIAPTRLTGAADDLEAAASTGAPVTGVEEEMTNATAEEDPGEDTDDEPVRRGLMIPASMGLRFQVPADPTELESITVHVSWGTYEPTGRDDADVSPSSSDPASSRDSRTTRYRRIPHDHSLPLRLADLTPGRTQDYVLEDDVTLRVDSYRDTSPAGGPGGRCLIELALCNDQITPHRIPVHAWMFQTQIHVDAGNRDVFLPVHDPLLPPAPGAQPARDPEEARLELQYRDRLEFAVGRTCSADWSLRKPPPGESAPRRAFQVRTTWMPTVETPQTTATPVQGAELNMRTLATAAESQNTAPLRDALEPIAESYTAWLGEQETAVAALPEHLRDTGAEALAEALQVRDQLTEGIDHLLTDPEARRCFAFMNRVMADQRVRSQIAAARAVDSGLSIKAAEARVLAGGYPHHWRVFQLAFILMQLPALTDPALPRRSGDLAAAQLLFFPTGGGKTEAYLGLAAYAFAIRRRQGLLETPDGPIDGRSGVTVLMRYTLRLLTSQQFQRAATLVCAAELARREDPATWGEEPFRIGLWVGTAVSPKRVSEAEDELKRLNDRGGSGAGYRFSALQLGHCPWCGRPLTPGDVKIGSVAGSADRVILRCSDELGECPFSEGDGNVPDGLPVLTTDEEIYRLAPAFVIATVDKLARLAREGHAATLFGHVARRCERHGYVPHPGHDSTHDFTGCTLLGENGRHQAKGELPAATIRPGTRLRPPDLIIQDELHLITGALGTTVGLFETAVETMCAWTDQYGRPARPLLVASSATVRNVADQVHSLYGRDVTVFPPQVLDASDTFFSRMVPADKAHPGRMYVGLSTTGVRLTAAEIQTTQTLMAGAQLLFDRLGAAADPYMTLVGYFSATRELAGMARYIQDDIQTGLTKAGRSRLPRRRGTDFGALHLGELTSRIASADITATLDRMALAFDPDIDSTAAKAAVLAAWRAGKSAEGRNSAANPYDVVLATSMLQVGVDVPRLGLMLVVGQPKNTAEYIQATSRVGRDPNRPGLVITLGNWARPRDLAHYEQFRHFHETFYARVEPLTVTPFSVTSIDRGLDGALVAAARVTQAGKRDGLNPEHNAGCVAEQGEALDLLVKRLADRIGTAAGEEEAKYSRDRLSSRLGEWKKRRREVEKKGGELVYERGADNSRYFPLLRSAEAMSSRGLRPDEPPFVVAGSMREVQPEINLLVSPDPQRLADAALDGAPAWQRQEPKDDEETSGDSGEAVSYGGAEEEER